MKKLLIISIFTLFSLMSKAQYSDVVFVSSSIGLQYLEVPTDKNMHYNIGYWGVKASNNLIDETFHLSKFWAQAISFSIMISAAFVKELTDKKFDWKDIYYTGAGIGLGIISINLKF